MAQVRLVQTHIRKHPIRRSRKINRMRNKGTHLSHLHGVWRQVENSMKAQTKSTKGLFAKRIKENPFVAFGGAMLFGAVCALMLRK